MPTTELEYAASAVTDLAGRDLRQTIRSNIKGNTYGGIAAIILFPSGVGLMPKGDEIIACSTDFMDCRNRLGISQRKPESKNPRTIHIIMLRKFRATSNRRINTTLGNGIYA